MNHQTVQPQFARQQTRSQTRRLIIAGCMLFLALVLSALTLISYPREVEMNEQNWHQLTFFLLVGLRWALHFFYTTAKAKVPEDIISSLLAIVYLYLCLFAMLIGDPSSLSFTLLLAAILLRTYALAVLGTSFDYSVDYQLDQAIVVKGPYRIHRNPLLLGYWLELLAFISCLNLPYASLIALAIFSGILCGWHAHEDNNRFLNSSEDYQQYLARTGNAILNLIFPETPIMIKTRRFHIDTSAAYASLGLLVGVIFSLGYGISVNLFIFAIPSALVLSFVYWKITSFTSPLNYGFSFFGGLFGGFIATVLYLSGNHDSNFHNWTILGAAVAFGHPIGRLGCIAYGCCTGKPSKEHRPYYMAYRNREHRINKIQGTIETYCFPTVLIEALGQLVIAFLVGFWLKYSLPIWLIGYGSLRIFVQTIRTESRDITRVSIAVSMIVIGVLTVRYLPEDLIILTWNMPSMVEVLIATAIAMLLGAGLGLRVYVTDK